MKQYDTTMQGMLEKINQNLEDYLTVEGNEYDCVIEAMRYAVMNAGKRIRPILVLEFCRLHGGHMEDAMPFACAVELIHCYSLIHDDLPCMDNDDMRRGKPSCHKQFGESTALLAGDALLTKAFDIMSNAALGKKNPAAVLKCMQEMSYYAGADGMIGGQVMDLLQEDHPEVVTVETLSKMHNLKTAALMKASCEMGAICASADFGQILNAELYGESLGLAFQLIDDILDVIGNEAQLGKPIGSDDENNKVTFLTLCGLEEAQSMASKFTDAAIGFVESYPENEFLKELTQQMLQRKS